METIEKIDAENLKMTETEPPKESILPKADIERNITNLEKDLAYFKGLLDYFK